MAFGSKRILLCVGIIATCCISTVVDGFVPSRVKFTRTLTDYPRVKPIPRQPIITRTIAPHRRLARTSQKFQKVRNIFSASRQKIGNAWKHLRMERKKLPIKTLLVAFTSYFFTFLFNPTAAHAMGAMGGIKGPVAAMERYAVF